MRGAGRLVGLKMINDLMNDLQINLFEAPERLVNLAFSVEFDKDFSLSRPCRRIREELEY
jgi:hypothetical protein